MKKYLKLMRVHHYLKNILVFAALACSGMLFDGKKFTHCLLGFVAFCMVCSVVYIINDIMDREKDRCHPTKCRRPIASGAVSVQKACALAAVLFIVACLCNYLVFSLPATLLLGAYLLLNLAYSFGLKNVPIVDVAILVSGFWIRVLYGALITDIHISDWLYLTIVMLAFFLALGKRRNELKRMKDGETREVLKAYPIAFLDKMMYMCLTLASVFYTLWTLTADTVKVYGEYLVYTVPIVMLITMRYSMDIEGNSDGDPVEVLVHDHFLMVLCLIYLASMLAILYR